MKKLMGSVVLVVCVLGYSQAQSSLHRTKKLTAEEVPAKVLTALAKDFPSLNDGTWYLEYKEQPYGKVAYKPLYYIYKGKTQDAKFEADYDTEGNLTHSKGLPKTAE